MNIAAWQEMIAKQQIAAEGELVLLLPTWCCGRDRRFGLDGCIELDIIERSSGRKAGELSARFGESRALFYVGHIGYHIDMPYRGHYYALEACRAAAAILRREELRTAVITTDPDNIASRKTCIALGCIEESTVSVPPDGRVLWQISACKVRYIWPLA